MAIRVPKLKSLKAARCAVTVEPMLFFYFFTTVLSTYVGSNLLLHKGCDPDATRAPDLSGGGPRCPLESEAQQRVSAINMAKAVVQELLTLTFVMFAGPWSDRHDRRRRPLMFVPVFGQIVCDAVNVLCTVFWAGVPPTVTGLAQSIIVSATGSFHCFLIGMYAYLSDITGEADRTMRLGFASAVLPLAATAGALCSGYLNVKLGFIGVFALNIVINVLALLLGLLFIYDTSEPTKPAIEPVAKPALEPVAKPALEPVKPASNGTIRDIKSLFDPQIVVTSFKTTFAKREGHKRVVLLLMILASPLTGVPFIGELSLMYLYLRKQFGFNEINFSLFNTYTMVIMLIGSLFSLGILSRLLKINDALIGLIATSFDIATAFGFLLVTQYKYLLYVPPLEIFRGAALSITGSIASKCVESHELGSMNSVRMIIESLSKSAIIPFYNFVYHQTLNTMPSAFFIVSICLTVPLIGCFGVSYYLTRNQEVNDTDGKPNDLNDKSTNDAKLNNIVGLHV